MSGAWALLGAPVGLIDSLLGLEVSPLLVVVGAVVVVVVVHDPVPLAVPDAADAAGVGERGHVSVGGRPDVSVVPAG